MYCTFHCVLSHCNFHVSLSLLLIALESKHCYSNDSNVQAATAKNEEQYTLSNMVYIKLQNCCVSFFEVYFEGSTPKLYTNQLKDVCNEVHFLTNFMFFCFFDELLFPRKPFSSGC